MSRRAMLGVGAGLAALSCAGSNASNGSASAPSGSTGGGPATLSTSPIPRRRLGRTGEHVSMLGLGGAHVGKPKDEATSIRLVRMAIDHGITFMDNSWDYNDGDSERRMGKALQDGYRERAFLMTKLDGRTRESAAKQLDQSLERLRTDRIDLVQIHEVIRMEDVDRAFAEDGAIEALVAAKKAGKLRYIGFTGHKDPKIHLHMLNTAFARSFRFDTVQMPLNVMDAHWDSFEKNVLPVLLQHDIGVLGMKSMADGNILKTGVVSAEECLRYALSLPTSVVITGCESVPILQQAIDIGRSFQPLSPEEKQAILAKTAELAQGGKYEPFKTTDRFDSTAHHPWWLTTARMSREP